MNKKIILSALVLIAICCLCSAAAAVTGGSLLIYEVSRHRSSQPTPLAAPAGSIDQQMDEIQQQVINLRGLPQQSPLQRDLLTEEELRRKVQDDFFKDYTRQEADEDLVTLSLLGLVPRDYPLYDLYVDLYSEQVAGYYDDETKEMYVVQGDGFNGVERMTYAHEFTHALQDQTWGLRDGLNISDEYCENHSEYCTAVRALIEGDATLTEQEWFTTLSTQKDRQDVQDFYKSYQSPVYDSAPEFLKKDFLFPYQEGAGYVQYLLDQGGKEAVNAAFIKPPQSSEQILHPEKYPEDLPVFVPYPSLKTILGQGWEILDDNNLGEWATYLVLSSGWDENARMSERTARKAAEGWGGDSYEVYSNGSGSILFYTSVWETPKDEGEFWDALNEYSSNRWGKPDETSATRSFWGNTPDGAVTLLHVGGKITWLITPDADTGQKIISSIK